MDEIAPLLEQLAQELQTTVGHLWTALVLGARAEALANCITIIILSACISLLWMGMRRVKAWIDREDDPSEDDFLAITICGLITCIGTGGLTIVSIHLFRAMIIQLTAPEYWALSRILQVLGD